VLTEKGEDLFATIVALRQWGDRWLFPKEGYPADMLDGRDQSPVARIEVRSEQGRKLRLANLILKARRTDNRRVVRYHDQRKAETSVIN